MGIIKCFRNKDVKELECRQNFNQKDKDVDTRVKLHQALNTIKTLAMLLFSLLVIVLMVLCIIFFCTRSYEMGFVCLFGFFIGAEIVTSVDIK